MKILFMCVANAARSQMAEGIARNIFDHRAEIQSAGSKPKQVHPLAKKVLSEIGIDISSHYSKSCAELSSDFCKDLDYLITLCAEEVCPAGFSTTAKKLHWPLKDPASDSSSELEQLMSFRQTRDEILRRIQTLVQQNFPVN